MIQEVINKPRKIRISLSKLYYEIQYFLRKQWYKRKKVNFGKNVMLESDIKFYKSGNGISIGDDSKIRQWVVFNPWGGQIEIGKNCSINSFCHISGNGGVYIGDNVLIATQCVIISANHNFERTDVPICKQGNTNERIVIEDDCWLGAGVKVLAGVTIGRGSVIGAGSVVTNNIPPFSIALGVPARVIKNRV